MNWIVLNHWNFSLVNYFCSFCIFLAEKCSYIRPTFQPMYLRLYLRIIDFLIKGPISSDVVHITPFGPFSCSLGPVQGDSVENLSGLQPNQQTYRLAVRELTRKFLNFITKIISNSSRSELFSESRHVDSVSCAAYIELIIALE